jgi:hypothetical protein
MHTLQYITHIQPTDLHCVDLTSYEILSLALRPLQGFCLPYDAGPFHSIFCYEPLSFYTHCTQVRFWVCLSSIVFLTICPHRTKCYVQLRQSNLFVMSRVHIIKFTEQNYAYDFQTKFHANLSVIL